MLDHLEPVLFRDTGLGGYDQREDDDLFMEHLPDFEPMQTDLAGRSWAWPEEQSPYCGRGARFWSPPRTPREASRVPPDGVRIARRV